MKAADAINLCRSQFSGTKTTPARKMRCKQRTIAEFRVSKSILYFLALKPN